MRMYAWVFALAGACWTGYTSAQVEVTASTTAPLATRPREITMHHRMLINRDAQQIAALINGLDEARLPMGSLDRVRALAETESNTLLVTGHPSAMEWALEVAKVMDTIIIEDDTFYIHPLKNADARDVVSLLRESLQPFIEKDEQQSGPNAVRTALAADVRRNAVLVATSTRMGGQIHDLLDKLDRPSLRLAVQVIEVQRAPGGGLGGGRNGHDDSDRAGGMDQGPRRWGPAGAELARRGVE